MSTNSVACDLRVEATLRNVSGLPFVLGRNIFQMSLSRSLSGYVPASTHCASELLAQSV
ncbi:MAG: hypothetical protein WBX08_00155 [Candidatus Sulfotelmatobacter sp.]